MDIIRLMKMIVLLLFFSQVSYASTVDDISIQRIHGRTFIHISGQGLTNWKDIVHDDPPCIEVLISNCKSKIRDRAFIIERGGIKQLTLKTHAGDYSIFIECNKMYGYTAYNDTENEITFSIAVPDSCPNMHFGEDKIDIFCSSNKFKPGQRMLFKWQFYGVTDSALYRYKFKGPIRVNGAELSKWSEWFQGKQGILERQAFEVKGKYTLLVQYLIEDTIKVEKEYRFQIK